MMTKEGSTKIVNFNTPMADVLMLGRDHRICNIFYSINIQHIDCYCVQGLWCCIPIPWLIFIYSMMRLLIYKYEPFWQEVGVKSLILSWPLRPVGLLFWRGGFFIFVNVFLLFHNYLPLEKGGALHLNKLNPLHPGMLCANFGWNWTSGSVECEKFTTTTTTSTTTTTTHNGQILIRKAHLSLWLMWAKNGHMI